ncbi:small conductance mechanosensitive channel [Clostridium cavendishii DSM 21758]|uniref:Small conductance mechanosensitive channel n=1 Tax=Clostridium cavendishii DSM 21758 TaxID=1121302 RepID=A0A1M6TJK7_9CLOT|nr:mechanosensitive ion channel domain-containing protein [Clostridium cavendishii]SHK57114.1 small conductance mechanosensitive channel [Clostridium cavendishii DSM 21758]
MNFKTLFMLDLDNRQITIGGIPISMDTLEHIAEKAVQIIGICILMCITIKIGNSIIQKMVDKQVESTRRFSMDTKKANTLGELLKSILKYTVYFFGIAAILTNIFGGISLTFASISGVAVGFGAQSLVKDVINGISILFEDQYAVGDSVTIGNFSGEVESLGIRTTVLKDASGAVHIIPNGSITTVTNHSKSDSRFIVDVNIDYTESIDKTIEIINKVCDRYSLTNDNITENPKVLGINSLNASGMTIRVMGKAKASTQAVAEREIRKEILVEFNRNDIKMPYEKRYIINEG